MCNRNLTTRSVVALKESLSANGRHAPDHERPLILTAAHKRFWTVCRIRILIAVSDMPKNHNRPKTKLGRKRKCPKKEKKEKKKKKKKRKETQKCKFCGCGPENEIRSVSNP